MKILLVQPPWAGVYGTYADVAKITNSYPPLGICYLSSVLKKQGHKTKIIDAEIEKIPIDQIIKQAEEFRPDVVAITSTTPIFHFAGQIASLAKERLGAPVIIGGAHVTALPVETIREGVFDCGVAGEGEGVINEVVERLVGKKPLSDLEGVVYRQGDEIAYGGGLAKPMDLASIPWPDRKGLRLDRYLFSVPKKGLVKFAPIMTTRGCPFKCIFCSAPGVFGKKVRTRPINDVLDEMAYIVNDPKIDHLIITDDTLTLDHSRIYQLCDGIAKRNLRFTWEGWTRANTINENVISAMKKSGLVRLSFGIESGNPFILDKIKKGIKLEDLIKGYRIAKKSGLETRGSVMLGHPYETKKTLQDTLNFLKKLKYCDHMHISITTPYPGTELYQMVLSGEGGIKLLTSDFAEFKRYGDSVIEVNDLTREDLIRYQKRAFKLFYLKPSRILYNITRAGLKSAFTNGWAFAKSILLNKGYNNA
jgi:radical SAM superfamily enzyme YgiQ (UPF0313 family)